MTGSVPTIAVLGGDEREHHIATALAQWGARVRVHGGAVMDPHAAYDRAKSARSAVAGADWVLCPYPGLADGSAIYAPAAGIPIRLDREVLAASAAQHGGLILGRANDAVRALCEDLDIDVFESKADSGLAVRTASAVSEALLALLIESTDRLLHEHLVVVVGFGSTGFAITQLLLALRCDVVVAARSKQDRERARQLGAVPIEYAERTTVMETSDLIINTVPHSEAVPLELGTSRTTARIFDIASPPGGMDHRALVGLGFDVNWMRGLGGLRAPVSMADAQLTYIQGLIGSGWAAGPARIPAVGSQLTIAPDQESHRIEGETK